jgi:hypothetical protein
MCQLTKWRNEMTTLNNLKLVAAKRVTKISPVQHRRNKLNKMIWEQMELCKAKQAGTVYAPMRLRTVKNKETGEHTTMQMPKRVRAWHWVAENGKTCLAVHYGAKTIELAKGKTAVELDSEADLLATLETIKQAVEAGELDAAIEAMSGAVKGNFKK